MKLSYIVGISAIVCIFPGDCTSRELGMIGDFWLKRIGINVIKSYGLKNQVTYH